MATMSDTSFYEKLAATAKGFVLSTSPKRSGTNEPNPEAILATLSPDAEFTWGHTFFVGMTPMVQGTKSGQGFVDNMSGIASRLGTWDIKVNDEEVVVDEKKREVIVRASFSMQAKGQEPVLNDIIFWLKITEDGEKVQKVKEFIDPTANAELGKRIAASQESSSGNSTMEGFQE